MSAAPILPSRLAQPQLWMHEDVLDAPKRWPHLSKRLGLVLQHMKAFDKTTILKTCQGANRGWYRSPLGGGSSGMRFYLWWTRGGSPQLQGQDPGPGRHILVRAIRAHDDHKPLDCGDLAMRYCEIQADDLEDTEENFVTPPWTDAQVKWAADTSPVRLIHGPPGSGKTSVLWRSVETLTDQRVLYLTWSPYLTELAQARFAAFAPAAVAVQCLDFTSCLSQLGDGRDIPRPTLPERIQGFEALVAREGWKVRDRLGPWRDHVPALYAELRGVLLGQALPGADDACTRGDLVCLSNAAYAACRTDDLGAPTVDALLNFMTYLEDRVAGSEWEEVFPDLFGADRALARLRLLGVPEELAGYTQVAVDELQDLTLREIAVVTELCQVLGEGADARPGLALAADAGQTVRPTAFDIARVNDLLHERLGTAQECPLDSGLRSPQRLAEVIDRASEMYAWLDKAWRPTDQRQPVPDPYWEAERLHAVAPDWEMGRALLQALQDDHQVNLVCLREEDRKALPDTVVPLDPETIKGMDFETICLLNPGQLHQEIDPGPDALAEDGPLETQHRRTQIDRLRVALSRATATLIFLDIASPPDAIRRSRELLGETAVYTAPELLAHLDSGDRDPAERAVQRAQEAQALLSTDPRGAWFRAQQACSLLGTPGVPNSVSDEDIREEVVQTALAIGAQALAAATTGGLDRGEVAAQGETLLKVGGNATVLEAWTHLARWGQNPAGPPFDLLDAWVVAAAEAPWLRQALAQRRRTLMQQIEAGPDVPAQAPRYAGPVEAWLRGLDQETAAVPALRQRATDTLLKAQRLDAAESMLRLLGPDEDIRWGQLWEGRGQWEKAAHAYKRALGLPDDAV